MDYKKKYLKYKKKYLMAKKLYGGTNKRNRDEMVKTDLDNYLYSNMIIPEEWLKKQRVNEEGGYALLNEYDNIDNYKPIRPFVLSAHSSGITNWEKRESWTNTLNIPIFIVLYSKHGNCGITHYEDILTKRSVAVDLHPPDGLPVEGYKEIFEKYNSIKDAKYEDVMNDFFDTLFSEQPEVNPELQKPLIIPKKTTVELAVDFYGGFDSSEPHGWLADVFEQKPEEEPKFLIDKRFKEVEEGEPKPDQKILFSEILNAVVKKITPIPDEKKPGAAIIFMGCCRGSGGNIE